MPIQFLFNVYFAPEVGAESVQPHVYMLANSSQGQHVKSNDQTTFTPMDSLGHIDTSTFILKNKIYIIFFLFGPFFHIPCFYIKTFWRRIFWKLLLLHIIVLHSICSTGWAWFVHAYCCFVCIVILNNISTSWSVHVQRWQFIFFNFLVYHDFVLTFLFCFNLVKWINVLAWYLAYCCMLLLSTDDWRIQNLRKEV